MAINSNTQARDEHLERLWYLKEQEKDSLAALKKEAGEEFNPDAVAELEADGLVAVFDEGVRLRLTAAGEQRARNIVRAHRLGERLIFDAFGKDFEFGACEFEHVVTQELVDGICVLLGHPRECPHGSPIPPGECCKRAERVVESPAVLLTELKVGESGRVVWVNTRDDRLIHKMDGLHIRPGSVIKVHQKSPSFVLECEGASIALSSEVAESICVWAIGRSRGAPSEPKESSAPRGWLRRLRGG